MNQSNQFIRSLISFFFITILTLQNNNQYTEALRDRSGPGSSKLKGWSQLGPILRSKADSMYDGIGHAIATSSNGKIIALGAPYLKNNAGQVTIHKYDDSLHKWTQYGHTIYGLEHGDFFGFDVGMNKEGNAIIVSSPTANGGTGFVQVFNYDDLSKSWEQVGETIEGTYSREEFGFAVAMSESGDHIAIGAPYASDQPGRVVVYRYYDGKWMKQGNDIVGETNEDEAGETIDILEHGPDVYVAVGAPMDLSTEGTATVFQYNRIDTDWEIMDRYVDGDDVGTDFGRSVSLGHDGTNVILAVGFPGPGVDENSDPLSGVQVYSISPEKKWDYYGQMIFAVEQGDDTGDKVSLSSDGKTLAISSPEYGEGKGLVRIFKKEGKEYKQVGENIIGDEDEELGFSVVMSRDGNVVSAGSMSGRYAVSYIMGHYSPSASRSALGIIVLTFFVFFIVATCSYGAYNGVKYLKQRYFFSSVPQYNEDAVPQPSTQMMTFPVQQPPQPISGSHPVPGVESDEEEDEEDDDDGVSYADDDIDYETHLRQIT